MTGRLIAVVGPSGVGKDSVIAAIAEAWPEARPVRRTITRPADAGGEDFEAVTPETFRAMRAAGRFCLWWEAHGLGYGLPAALPADIAAGGIRLANLSRRVLDRAAALFPGLEILELTARPDVLARRLHARGREDADDIARRLTRDAVPFPATARVIRISNDGALDRTVAAALDALRPEPSHAALPQTWCQT